MLHLENAPALVAALATVATLTLAPAVAHAQIQMPTEGGCTRPEVAALVAPQPLTIEGATSHVYKSVNGSDLRAHVVAPEPRTTSRAPAMVFFFGGGWKWGNVTDALQPARYLASRGMVSILVDYRVWCRHRANVARQLADARSAIRWVRSQARELGVDPDRIAATGGSSGGHIALAAAVFDQFDEPSDDEAVSAKPNALVLFFPCVDLTSEEERRYSAVAFGDHGSDVSPLFHVTEGLPPMAIYQGTDDPIYAGVVKFVAEATSVGNEVEFQIYEGAPHGFTRPTFENGRWYRQIWAEADRFLTARGYLRGPAQGPK